MPLHEPCYDEDLYSDAVIADPYPHYRALRDLGPAVWLRRNDLWAVSRHAEVRECLRDHAVFSSASGIAANERANQASVGTMIASDPPEHERLRRVVAEPLLPRALDAVRERIKAAAEDLVDRLLAAGGACDAVSDLARVLPLTIVSDLVGLPEEGRGRMLRWAAATFDLLGADNERARAALPDMMEMGAYTRGVALSGRFVEGSWAARLFAAGEAGLVPKAMCPSMMLDYLAPSLDTTIFATAHLIRLLGENPDQWHRLRADPSLVPGAVNEAIRLEAPIRGFTRLVRTDHILGGTMLPAGSRVLLLFASANRDERKWPDADRFDVGRTPNDHLGFGFGVHACPGMQLARLEMRALLEALARRVTRIEVGEPVITMNNVLRGLDRLPVRLVPA
jgi:cytochrome P450